MPNGSHRLKSSGGLLVGNAARIACFQKEGSKYKAAVQTSCITPCMACESHALHLTSITLFTSEAYVHHQCAQHAQHAIGLKI